jgi:hypothetical protein
MKPLLLNLAWSALYLYARAWEAIGRLPPGETAAVRWLESHDDLAVDLERAMRVTDPAAMVRIDRRVNARGAEGWQ